MALSDRPFTRRSVLAFSSALPLTSGSPLMAQQTDQDFYYYLTFRSVGSFYIARLNGVTISDRAAVRRHEFAVPVNTALVAGENLFEFIFVPAWGDAYPMGQPNPEFAMLANLRQLNLQTREEREFGIASVAFDMANGEVVSRDVTSLGPAKGAGQVDFGRLSEMQVTEGVYTDIHGPPIEARVISVRFNIPSDLPGVPWANAPELEDSIALRSEMASAYERLHNAITAADFGTIQRLFQTSWTHMAGTLAYASLEEFLEAGKQRAFFVPRQEEGQTLGPLSFLPSLQEVRLELMAEGRLARFDPAPIHWTAPGDPSKRAVSSHVAFFRGPEGDLQIGTVLLGV